MDLKIINGIRNLGIDMINGKGFGYPGVTLSMAPIFYTLFANHLNFNKDDAEWINRDRFVLSANHASALLYSTLLYSGYDISLDEIREYGKSSLNLGAYPILNKKLGIEMTNGLMGEGIAVSVGMAIAEEYLRNLIGSDIINHYTYVFASDGDLMEGISYEAMSLAGSLKLGKLIILYDSNNMCSDSTLKGVFDDNIIKRCEALGFHIEEVNNTEDINSIDKAIVKAKNITDKPSLIVFKSVIGIGTSLMGTPKAHMGVLDEKDTLLVKEKMGVSIVPYYVSKEAITYMQEKQEKRIMPIYNKWIEEYNKVVQNNLEKKSLLEILEKGSLKINFKNININFDDEVKEDIRITNKKLMNLISSLTPLFIGGSTDNEKNTFAVLDNIGYFKIDNIKGRNIRFGVRERSMGAILNGIALMGLRPFGSSLLSLSDSMKPSIRLSAMMNLPVTYIFTNDSIKIGTESSIYAPIEQLGSLRMIPNMHVFRPADVNELVGSWDYIINKKVPSSLVLSNEIKGKLKTSKADIKEGAYIIKESLGRLSGIIVATGSEVEDAINISNDLDKRGLFTRVVSVPCLELFQNTEKEYKDMLFPTGIKVVVIEASNDPVWNELVYNKKYILNINKFGLSIEKDKLLENLEFNYEKLLEKVEKLLK